jgi:hypothetical protein
VQGSKGTVKPLGIEAALGDHVIRGKVVRGGHDSRKIPHQILQVYWWLGVPAVISQQLMVGGRRKLAHL